MRLRSGYGPASPGDSGIQLDHTVKTGDEIANDVRPCTRSGNAQRSVHLGQRCRQRHFIAIAGIEECFERIEVRHFTYTMPYRPKAALPSAPPAPGSHAMISYVYFVAAVARPVVALARRNGPPRTHSPAKSGAYATAKPTWQSRRRAGVAQSARTGLLPRSSRPGRPGDLPALRPCALRFHGPAQRRRAPAATSSRVVLWGPRPLMPTLRISVTPAGLPGVLQSPQ